MDSLVLELQRDALNPSVGIVELLQKSLVVASKLTQVEFAAWVNRELDGYGDGEVPSYRVLHGSLKVFNPYRGYQPLFFENTKTSEIYSKMHFNQPVGEIEHSLLGIKGKKSTTFAVNFSTKVEQNLMKGIEFNLQPSLHINSSQLQNVLDAVRKIVLEWALKLEASGVLGAGLTFTIDEQKRAGTVTYNVRNLIQGQFSSAQIQIETVGSQQTQTYKRLDPTEVSIFLNELKKKKDSLNVGIEAKAELEAELRTIDAQIASPKPKDTILRDSLESVKRILEGAAGNLMASGLLDQLGRLFGA